jgi:toxin YoeB
MYKILFSKLALKDASSIKSAGLDAKCQKIISTIQENPFSPVYEKLIGDLDGFCSRRINIQHRLIYEIDQENKIIKIFRMWSHYE